MNPIRGDADSHPPSNMLDPLAGWVTLAAFLAILILALFPFDFSAQATALRREGPALDWFVPVAKDWLGWFLNVLFFVPFGFALAWWARVKGQKRLAGGMGAVLAGFALSLAVETLQLYLPTRDSSWDDVLMNTLGALTGWLFFRFCGDRCLRLIESAMEDLSVLLER